jgi:hypothetical protein
MMLSKFRYGLIVLLALLTGACASVVRDAGAPGSSDDYVTWMRVVGLYPITRIPVAMGFSGWKEEYREDVEAWTGRDVKVWQPLALGPEYIRQHAPVLLIEEQTPFDRFGYPEDDGDTSVTIDTSRAIVTWRVGETSFRGETLGQISYAIWFPGRPKTKALDLLSGSLDSIIFRVTLAPDGKPLLYDTIHGCGCYHLFFPVPPTARKPMPEDNDMREEAFVPFAAPVLQEGQRLGIRITAGAHYIVGLDVVSLEAISPASDLSYSLVDAGIVDEGINHLYNRHGILPQSKRLERFLLWPMGIRSPGAMRAWGRHATAFVGKRHFDDPDLLDRAFE